MGGPAWLTDIFAAASLAVAVYCAGRLVVAPRWRRPTELDTDGAHVVMGVAMAGMLVSGLRTLPSTIWEIVFAVGAGWFGYRMLATRRGAPQTSWRSAHPLPHLVECAAMVFMFLVLPATVAESRFSFLTLALALFLFGYAVWLGDRITFRAPVPSLAPAAALVPAALIPTALIPTALIPTALALAPAASVPASSAASAAPDTSEPVTTADDASPATRCLAPRCAAICKITMGITMGYMLILML